MSDRPWILRKATQNDLDAVVKLVNSAYRGDSSREGWTTEADFLDGQRTDRDYLSSHIKVPGNHIYIVEMTSETQLETQILRKGELIGCVELREDGDCCYLGMLTVKPTIQNSGLGGWILGEGENLARQWKKKRMYMTVITIRSELIEWYERKGYRRTGKINPFHSDPRFGLPKRKLEMEILEKNL